MKKNTWITILTCLAAAALLGSCILWIIELTGGRQDGTAVCGAAVSVAGLGCLLAQYIASRSQNESVQAEHQVEMEALAISHREETEQMKAEQQREIESFRSTLSHSLRMPVAIIQGYAELLTSDMVEDPKDQKMYLEKIVQRSRYMTEVMSRQFSAGETMDSQQLNYTEFDLLELIRQAGNDMQGAAAEKSVEIQVLSTEDELPVEADAYLLNRAVLNLIENSLKYMGRPGTVTIRVQREEEQATVVVRDDGIGLSSEETPRVFDACFRGSEHMNISGQGYGLHLVKQTVEAHGGQVWAESSPGYGMLVTMQFPMRPVADKE